VCALQAVVRRSGPLPPTPSRKGRGRILFLFLPSLGFWLCLCLLLHPFSASSLFQAGGGIWALGVDLEMAISSSVMSAGTSANSGVLR
jgi:hypothetical protein